MNTGSPRTFVKELLTKQVRLVEKTKNCLCSIMGVYKLDINGFKCLG